MCCKRIPKDNYNKFLRLARLMNDAYQSEKLCSKINDIVKTLVEKLYATTTTLAELKRNHIYVQKELARLELEAKKGSRVLTKWVKKRMNGSSYTRAARALEESDMSTLRNTQLKIQRDLNRLIEIAKVGSNSLNSLIKGNLAVQSVLSDLTKGQMPEDTSLVLLVKCFVDVQRLTTNVLKMEVNNNINLSMLSNQNMTAMAEVHSFYKSYMHELSYVMDF